jgi:MFS family permease
MNRLAPWAARTAKREVVIDAETIHRRRWAILAVLCLSVFLAVVDNTIVNVALPTISRRLHATTSELQWIVDAYSLVFASLLLVGGAWATGTDAGAHSSLRKGRRCGSQSDATVVPST